MANTFHEKIKTLIFAKPKLTDCLKDLQDSHREEISEVRNGYIDGFNKQLQKGVRYFIINGNPIRVTTETVLEVPKGAEIVEIRTQ